MDVEKIESDWTMFQNLTQKLEDENINTLLDELSEKLLCALLLQEKILTVVTPAG